MKIGDMNRPRTLSVFLLLAALAHFPACSEDRSVGGVGESRCNDGLDNDTDGYTDCDDEDCVNDPAACNLCIQQNCMIQWNDCANDLF